MSSVKADRNDPCPCGSGKKYKKCCMLKSGMQKYQASVIKNAGSSLLGKISAFGSMMKEQKEELMDKKIQASLPSSKKSEDPSKKSE